MIPFFLGEQIGLLWAFERDTSAPGGWQKLEEPFMNLTVYYERLNYDEQGFLALRFHPKYSENGLFYSWYSVFKTGEEFERASRLSEFRVILLFYLSIFFKCWRCGFI